MTIMSGDAIGLGIDRYSDTSCVAFTFDRVF